MFFALLLLYAFGLTRVTVATGIGTFTDNKCTKSHDLLTGPNGYPDGTCTPLNLTSSLPGFQVVGLDSGCAVTIYGHDDETNQPCSSPTKIVAELASCYNSSWVYYSIDGCDPPGQTPSAAPTLSTTPQHKNSSNIGAIVGGIVGGVVGIALVIIVIFLCYRQRKGLVALQTPPPSYELPNGAVMELHQSEKKAHTELYAHEAAVEMGRNSTYIPPAELPAEERLEAKKYAQPEV
ncbi:uncharacterized protein BDR25DRAFT_327148 [Lindgomyces ingoldianus]|uniref:Uncharacterized protein n=1 Tax=Lindgomyces ingoldianus TaxID=673940 RepID=A0ACB6QPB8_9PLEO|nr:uncharacterized protein BDR25DRAFT_327148 [Lindgomyces ingoldianus]KAF2467947.1 hypothetical protein BDR25DRAFT_327148 [Lindgomyces ingoldianus]